MRGAMEVGLKYIQPIPRRNGSLRYFFRRKGFPRVRLPGKPGSPEFQAAWAAAMAWTPPVTVPATRPDGAIKGTLAALIEEYQRSAHYNKRLAVLTRREMGYVLKKLLATNGDVPVAGLEPGHIYGWQDDLQDKPGAANKFIRTVKTLMKFAVQRGYRNTNPAVGIGLLKVGSFRAWTQKEMAAFESKWTIGVLERTGYALALYTGQRRADLVTLTFSNIVGNSFRLRQQKTGKELEIPIHPELRKALPAIYPNDDTPILARKARRPLNPIYFGHLMASAIASAGLPDDCVLHGLRKSAAVALIDAGCTPHQAAAVTGHASMRMLEEYVKGRDQAKLGRDAMGLWEKVKR